MRVPDAGCLAIPGISNENTSIFLRGLGVTESGNTFDTFSHIYFQNRTDSIITHYIDISPFLLLLRVSKRTKLERRATQKI
jgi:hypothetical protein